MPYEETHRLLQCHTHSLVKDPEHYLEPLPLPPEDIDPPKPVMFHFAVSSSFIPLLRLIECGFGVFTP